MDKEEILSNLKKGRDKFNRRFINNQDENGVLRENIGLDNLLKRDSVQYMRLMEQRQGLKVGCPEEVAFRMGFIDRQTIIEMSKKFFSYYFLQGQILNKIKSKFLPS